MRTIRISEEVWNEIAKLGKFGETPDDVLRRAFKISDAPAVEQAPPVRPHSSEAKAATGGDGHGRSFVTEGVEFPHATDFRLKWRREYKYAQVFDGALRANNQTFDSVSGAATHIKGYCEDGWRVWECKFPNEQDWRPISSLRRTPVRRRLR
jgi:hypothetical protein